MARKNATPHNEAAHLATLEKRTQVLELRRAGASLRDMERALGIDKNTAKRYLDEAMADLQAAQNEKAEATRAVELDRLERLHMALWPKAVGGKDVPPDYAAVDRLVRISERRSKLLGLDAPVKTDVNISGSISMTDFLREDGE